MFQNIRNNPINGNDPTGSELGILTAVSTVRGGSATAAIPVVGVGLWAGVFYQIGSFLNEQTGFSGWVMGNYFESKPYPVELLTMERPVEETTTHMAEDSGSDSKQTEEFDIYEGAKPRKETIGRSTQYDKPGDVKTANEEFDKMDLDNVQNKGEGKRVGTDRKGNTVIVRPTSKGKDPTVEIQIQNEKGKTKESIKFRYTQKTRE